MALSTCGRSGAAAAPAGTKTNFGPPRLRMEKGTRTRKTGRGQAWSCRSLLRPTDGRQLSEGAGEAVRAEMDVEAVDADVNPRDQELDDAGLLGGEELVPHRIKAFERPTPTSRPCSCAWPPD